MTGRTFSKNPRARRKSHHQAVSPEALENIPIFSAICNCPGSFTSADLNTRVLCAFRSHQWEWRVGPFFPHYQKAENSAGFLDKRSPDKSPQDISTLDTYKPSGHKPTTKSKYLNKSPIEFADLIDHGSMAEKRMSESFLSLSLSFCFFCFVFLLLMCKTQ